MLIFQGVPVEDIEFPAITICGAGSLEENIHNAIGNQILNYIKEKGNFTFNKEAYERELSISKGTEKPDRDRGHQ